MSHRIYIYNIAKPSVAKKTDVMITEWGYEIPLLLHPLLSGEGFIDGNIYNNHTEPDNFGLYFDAKSGVENLKSLYNFLENHHAELIDDFESFLSAKLKLFNFLDNLKQAYFHVDAWDVFNMSNESHSEQASDLLRDIKQNNAVFENAIAANDISLLDFNEFTREVTLGFNTFKELLNYPDYNYGWAHIYEESEEEREVEIFEQNGLWGLKSVDDKLIVEPYYDDFYNFDYYTNLAVVVKNKKYGYINKQGIEVIPLIFDDAFDFEAYITTIVKIGEKYGLIDLNGNITLEAIYDEIKTLGDNELYCAKLANKYGVISSNGEIKIDFISDNVFESGRNCFFTKVNGQKAAKIYTSKFVFIGDFPTTALEDLAHKNILIKPHKNQQKHKIFNAQGNLVVDEFDKIMRNEYLSDAIIIVKNKKKGVLHLENSSLILSFEYDQILEMGILSNGSDSQNILRVEKDGLMGVKEVANPEKWIVELGNYDDAIFLSKNIYALKQGDKWALKYLIEDEPLIFEYDLICRKPLINGVAYALFGNDVYTVNEDGLEFANAYEVLEDVNDPYYMYYFDADAKKKLSAYVQREIGITPA